MQQYTGSAQVLQLVNLEQGQLMMIIITGATSTFDVEFKHGTDNNWHKHPLFTNVESAASHILELRCPSGLMRINFAEAPGTYTLSTVWEASHSF